MLGAGRRGNEKQMDLINDPMQKISRHTLPGPSLLFEQLMCCEYLIIFLFKVKYLNQSKKKMTSEHFWKNSLLFEGAQGHSFYF